MSLNQDESMHTALQKYMITGIIMELIGETDHLSNGCGVSIPACHIGTTGPSGCEETAVPLWQAAIKTLVPV